MRYLECIAAALQDMSHTYVPAQRMAEVLEAVILELRDTIPEKTRTVPARRSSSTLDSHDRPSSKRHQSFRYQKSSSIHEHEGRPSDQQQRPPLMHQGHPPLPDFQDNDNQTMSDQQHDTRSLNSQISDNGFLLVTSSQQGIGVGEGGWHDPSQDSASFEPVSAGQHFRSVSFPAAHQPSQSFSGFPGNPHINEHQQAQPREASASAWRSAWMGAETPRAGFSPAPPSPPTTSHQTKLPSPPSSRGAHIPELDDFMASLLHPGDRLDFGSLDGMTITMPMSVPMAPDLGFSGTRDLDGYSLPRLPTPKSSVAGSDWSTGDGSTSTGKENAKTFSAAGRDTTRSPEVRRNPLLNANGNDQGFARTMAGLADILSRGGRGG